ncbi:hypothetical protein I4N56_009570 [Pseudomonas mohnii]|uniref:hypothetical protein n=1 Tax=Pseudomonas mohnii TaxID=395600 RepID=UPI0018DC5ED7|nr:hypothetical protein [Pseudomonas mohnii]MBH8611160.1 hypothetical protein [Pseudomonas mohnii]
MPGIERIIEAMTAPSPPAAEVVTLDRNDVERALALLESHPDIAEGGPSLCQEVCVFRQALAEPKVELWAIHSVGPGEEYPCLNKEDAERRARELRDLGERMKQERIARGESVELWHDWVTNVIPSPWEPAEHFEIMAEEWAADADDLRQHSIALKTERDQLKAESEALRKALGGMLFAFDDGVGLDWSAELLDHARTLCPAAEFKP